jgi:hypothetical protein
MFRLQPQRLHLTSWVLISVKHYCKDSAALHRLVLSLMDVIPRSVLQHLPQQRMPIMLLGQVLRLTLVL